MWRIAKFPPLTGVAFDVHQAISAIVPPSPVPIPTVPVNAWVHTFINIGTGAFLTGKYTRERNVTEGMGDIIWGYDWGPLQLHIPLPPVTATPSIALLALASQVKFWLPAFSVKQPIDGAFRGGETPIAVCFPAWMIFVQTCQDIAGWGFVLPNGICFVVPSTRHVGVTFGDFLAGMIGMAGDALGNLALSGFGNMVGIPNSVGGGIAGAMMNNATTALNTWLGTMSSEDQDAGAKVLGLGLAGTGLGVPILIGWGAGKAANAVGDAWQPPSSGSAPPASGSGSSSGSGS